LVLRRSCASSTRRTGSSSENTNPTDAQPENGGGEAGQRGMALGRGAAKNARRPRLSSVK
jgi:hypothetical protein